MLNLGVSKIDITPKKSLPLVGFGFREGGFEDIHTNIYLKTFVLKLEKTVIFICADLIWWGNDGATIFKENYIANSRLKDDILILHATHTHCAPHISNQFSKDLGAFSEYYRDFVFECALKSIEEAYDNIEEVNVYKNIGKTKTSINRRLKTDDGTVKMAPNPNDVIDDSITIIRFESVKNGSVKGMWANATSHPTCSGDNKLSMEFQALAVEKLASNFDCSVAAYLQGFCGNTRVNLTNGNEFYRGNLDKESEQMANTLYNEMSAAIQTQKEKIEIEQIQYKESEVLLPLNYNFEHSDYEKYTSNNDFVGNWAKTITSIENKPKSLPLKISCLSFGEDFKMLFVNGEVVVEYSLFAKEICPSVICLGYSNGMLTYIPTKKHIEEKGYEGYDALFWFNIAAPFDENI